MTNEYSVFQFFEDDTYECVAEFVSEETAVKKFQHYIDSVAAKVGLVERVIITDGGDDTCAEWIKGKGITFPK